DFGDNQGHHGEEHYAGRREGALDDGSYEPGQKESLLAVRDVGRRLSAAAPQRIATCRSPGGLRQAPVSPARRAPPPIRSSTASSSRRSGSPLRESRRRPPGLPSGTCPSASHSGHA